MQAKLQAVLDAIFLDRPAAIATTRLGFRGGDNLLLDQRTIAMLGHEGWTRRHRPDGHEGTAAFREKRRPAWYKPPAIAAT